MSAVQVLYPPQEASDTSRIVTSPGTSNATLAKAGPGDLFSVRGQNVNPTPRFLKFYDQNTVPVVGVDIPVMTVALPGTTTFTEKFDPLSFKRGIAYAITARASDSDTTAVSAGDIVAFTVAFS